MGVPRQVTENEANFEISSLLTQKQIDVLELVTKLSTSKEISRVLGISPHTVYQRIESAKRRLGVTTRRELIQAYLSHKRLCERLTYEEFHMAIPLTSMQQSSGGDEDDPVMFVDLAGSESSYLIEDTPANRIVPLQLEGTTGTLYRLSLIVAISALLILVILAIVTIFAQVDIISLVEL